MKLLKISAPKQQSKIRNTSKSSRNPKTLNLSKTDNSSRYILTPFRTMAIIIILFMSFHKILAEPAKTSRGTCKRCKRPIEQNTIKIQIADDRKFNDYIRRNGGRSVFHGEGMSRGGYIETENGVISIERYFVHPHCYTPIHPHPWTKEYFRMERFKP
jgi:hypothetical protein